MPVLRAKDEKDREDHPVWVYAAEVPVYQPCVPEIRGHAAGGVLMETFYKITNPDGTAFHDGQTKYELGKTVKKRKCNNPILCTDTVLHASRTLAGALRYAKVPLAIWKVEGDPVVSDHEDNCGFFALKVVKQIEPSDELLGFRYHEACHGCIHASPWKARSGRSLQILPPGGDKLNATKKPE